MLTIVSVLWLSRRIHFDQKSSAFQVQIGNLDDVDIFGVLPSPSDRDLLQDELGMLEVFSKVFSKLFHVVVFLFLFPDEAHVGSGNSKEGQGCSLIWQQGRTDTPPLQLKGYRREIIASDFVALILNKSI